MVNTLLQEIHFGQNEHRKLKREWVNQVFHALYGKRRGLGILINRCIPFSPEKGVKAYMGRYVIIIGTFGEITISILNSYAQNVEKETFFKSIAKVIVSNGKAMILIRTISIYYRIAKWIGCNQNGDQLQKKCRVLNNVIKEVGGLFDPWRYNNSSGRDFTFYS